MSNEHNILADIETRKTSIGSKTLMDIPCVHTKAQIDDQGVEERREQANARKRHRSAEEQQRAGAISLYGPRRCDARIGFPKSSRAARLGG